MGRIVDISEVLLEMGLSSSPTEEERAIISASIDRAEGAVRRFLDYDPVQATRTEYYPQGDYRNNTGRGVWDVAGSQAIFEQEATGSNNELYLRHIPIRSITSLGIDFDGRGDSNPSANYATKTEGSDYWANWEMQDDAGATVCRDGILRSFGIWPETPGSVKIVYIAGYNSDELHGNDTTIDATPIFNAVMNEAIRKAKTKLIGKKGQTGFASGPLVEESIGHYRYRASEMSGQQTFGGMFDLMPETKDDLQEFVNYGYRLAG